MLSSDTGILCDRLRELGSALCALCDFDIQGGTCVPSLTQIMQVQTLLSWTDALLVSLRQVELLISLAMGGNDPAMVGLRRPAGNAREMSDAYMDAPEINYPYYAGPSTCIALLQ